MDNPFGIFLNFLKWAFTIGRLPAIKSLRVKSHSVTPGPEKKPKAPVTINFEVTVTDGTPPYKYEWVYGDGEIEKEGYNKKVSHFYWRGKDGEFNPSCTITDQKGRIGKRKMKAIVERQKFEDQDETVAEGEVQTLYSILAPKIRQILPDNRGYDWPIEIIFEDSPMQGAHAKKKIKNGAIVGYYITYHRGEFDPNQGGTFTAGTILHEFVHVIQCYDDPLPGGPDFRPIWLVEGIADYVRYAIFEKDYDLDSDGGKDPKSAGSRTAAHFLQFLEGKYPGIVVDLHQKMSNKKFREESTWKEFTGKTYVRLKDEYMTSTWS